MVASLLATAKLNDIEPFAYLKDVLERMCSGHPISRLDDLLPWNWTPSTAAVVWIGSGGFASAQLSP